MTCNQEIDSQRMGHRKATGTRFVEKTFDSQVASFQGRVAKLEAVQWI